MDIRNLKGVGAARAELLAARGIHNVRDLLLYFPRDFDDRRNIKAIADLTPMAINTFRAVIYNLPARSFSRGKSIVKLKIKDSTASITLTWFNQPYMTRAFVKEREYLFTGYVTENPYGLEMRSPIHEEVCKAQEYAYIIPIYPNIHGISQKIFRAIIKNALDIIKSRGALSVSGIEAQLFPEILPDAVMAGYNLMTRLHAIINIHMPQTPENFYKARRRLSFENFCIRLLALAKLKEILKVRCAPWDKLNVNIFLSRLPFPLTDGQHEALNDILRDMSSGYVMNRLIQGDVGCGKTAVAMAACYAAIQNKRQAALMAPTEVLARQHYISFNKVFAPLDIQVVLLIGGMPKSEHVKNSIKNGTAKMIIGTHALIQTDVEFYDLGLVITDEQHRFGVRQRLGLSEKGGSAARGDKINKCHVLIMTATPIPRTLALVLYGDMDYTRITGLPPGRNKVDTFYVTGAYRARVHKFIDKEVKLGHQVYVVCPSIETITEPMTETITQDNPPVESVNTAQDMQSVTDYAAKLSLSLPGVIVSVLHGKMKPYEKQEVMDLFYCGKIDVLVSTTVIEVGVNVPNASLMIVENADRFGLSQLHQLRGRVGRGKDKACCILISDAKSRAAIRKLKAMEKISDGFELAELDLRERGPGDFFGTAQHGTGVVDTREDMDILDQAQSAADLIIKNGTHEREPLAGEVNRALGSGIISL